MTQRKRGLILLLTLVLIIAISAWKGWQWFVALKTKEYMANMKTAVEAAVATPKDWQNKIQASGTLNAIQGVMLKSQVAGNVTQIYFHSGDEVKFGDVLLEINPGILKANLISAQAKANLMSGDYDRAIALFKRGALSKQDTDTALANKESALADLAAVKAQLAENVITAPFSGKLGITQYNLGDYINIGQALVNLQSIDTLRVDFSVPQNQFSDIAPGDTIKIRSDSLPGQVFEGQVSAIDTAVNVDTRTVAIRAEIPNPEHKLLPGSFVQVTLYAGSPTPLITIPQTAVVYDANGNYVYKIVNDVAVKAPVTILQTSKKEIAVSGLKEGDVVVTEGQLKISDGAKVHATH
ncbi:MAG: efflux RND transporter periplasmic adaptor subunit [Gammaproteobacteria bacterium]|nr:efflux RND transporter periplasmic adaptor subunit [Gammaproteobacteria bacterium]